jgi:hypothetical protein
MGLIRQLINAQIVMPLAKVVQVLVLQIVFHVRKSTLPWIISVKIHVQLEHFLVPKVLAQIVKRIVKTVLL